MGAQVVSVSVSRGPQAGPPATKKFTGTLLASLKDAYKQEKGTDHSGVLENMRTTKQQDRQYNRHPPVKGMCRLLDLIGESGSNGYVDEDIATSLLSPKDVGNPYLSLGLYIVRANATDLVDERHYIIYWPEDSTWNDSATSSARRNRVTFMRWKLMTASFVSPFFIDI
ncbi:hypothetical protein EDB83DRAFT_2587383, partial [Lactarius deliciosus]